MAKSKNLIINCVIEEVDYLVSELRGMGFEAEDILDGIAVYLEIAEDLDDPTQIGDLY